MTVYFVDGAVGDDGNAGTSEGAGNAWATISNAMSGVAAGDKVWIKDSATYFENATMITVGTDISGIVYEGYASITGDRSRATIDGSGLTNCVTGLQTNANLWSIFKNFRFTGADAACVDIGTDDLITFKNCRFDNAGGDGFNGGAACFFESCQFDNNTIEGADTTTAFFFTCVFFGQPIGLSSIRSYIGQSLFYGHSTASIQSPGSSAENVAINNTIDGAGSGGIGILGAHPSTFPTIIANNIIYDKNTGTKNISDEDRGEHTIHRNNLYNSNIIDHPPNFDTTGKVTSAPDFVDEASNDYRLKVTSPAVGAGLDAGKKVG